MNELILSEDSTMEIKDGKIVIKKSKSKVEIDKSGDIKVANIDDKDDKQNQQLKEQMLIK